VVNATVGYLYSGRVFGISLMPHDSFYCHVNNDLKCVNGVPCLEVIEQYLK